MLANKSLAKLGTPARSGTRGAVESEPGKEELERTPSDKRHRLGRAGEKAGGS